MDVTAFLSNPAIIAIVAGVFGLSPALPSLGDSAVADAVSQPVAAVESVLSPTTTGLTSGLTTALSATTSALAATTTAVAAPAAAAGPVGSGIPQPFIGPDPVGGGSSLDTISRLDGVALLDELGRLSVGELSTFIAAYPAALEELGTNPPAATAVGDWWERTPATARSVLSTDLPGVIGNLEGLPYTVRDAANRDFLATTIAGIHAQVDAGVGRAMEEELDARLEMLGAVEQSLQRGESGEPRFLISLDTTGEGRAVVGVGRLDRADYVTFFVPGMFIGVSSQLVDWTAIAESSLIEQEQWLDRLGLQGEVATVAWIGYHTPNLVNIAGLDLAYEGRDALTLSLQGLDVAGGDDPFVSIVAHSYGSTAAMLALEENDVTVDALIMVGSPGSPATSVDDLKVPGGNVWVAASDTDPVPRSGVFGSQPLDADFGAHRFSVHATIDPITGEKLTDSTGHVSYFSPGTTSMRNTALIALDQGALVSTDTALARSSAPRG